MASHCNGPPIWLEIPSGEHLLANLLFGCMVGDLDLPQWSQIR
jgi:hypothetical protein